jgi:hypothetical protein
MAIIQKETKSLLMGENEYATAWHHGMRNRGTVRSILDSVVIFPAGSALDLKRSV